MSDLEVRLLGPAWKGPLLAFFRSLEASGDDRWFRPHPFTEEAVDRLCRPGGRDLYYLVVDGEVVLGYGLLRGWDEGFAIPSLGIAIAPVAQHQGLGRALMHVLHAAARRRGAARVRLRVRPNNRSAISLYRSLGYRFAPSDGDDLMVGFLDLASP